MRVLILARHGESDYSARGLCNGDPSVPVGLTERGREQAARMGVELAGAEIDLCATSQFPRTHETADIALTGRSVPRIVLPELNDINYGDLEGRTRQQYHAWQREHGRDSRLPGGESRIDVARRAGTALQSLLSRSEPVILVVSHEIVIELVLDAAAGHDPDVERRTEYATPHRLPAEAVAAAARVLATWQHSE